LEAKDICKNYYSGKYRVEALKTTSFSVSEGSINVIAGKSGSGKSTLLNILGGLIKPDAGQVFVEQQSLYEVSDSKRTCLRNQKIGFIFQRYNLINELSIINNIRLPFDIAGLPYDVQAEKEIVSMLEINERLSFYPEQLSGGECQRTAIARALLMKPAIILADEPTGNLDLESGKNVMNFVETTNRERNQTYVIVTHDLEWLKIAHYVYKMSDGILSAEK
jgi:ABC-type antimicrobial peptide transport system, ATPase component